MSFPAHPFWEFSLSIYRRPGVADACLFLQDRYTMNVNVILLCLWVGAAGRARLTSWELDAALRRIRDWERTVIGPLREMRRACRQEPLGVPDFLLQAFRPRVEEIELDAEHVEQLVLADVIRDHETDPGAGEAIAVASLAAYLGVLDLPRDPPLVDCLDTIVGAAFPGARFAAAG